MGVTRRTLLRTSATAAGLAAVADTAWAVHTRQQAGTDPYRDVVRDARQSWQRLPTGLPDAPLLGSGAVTAQVHAGERPGTIDVVLSGIGPHTRLVLGLTGAVTAVDWSLDLWDAQLTGTITTTRGSVALAALVHATRNVLLVDLVSSPGEADAAWQAGDLSRREWQSGSRRLLVAGYAGAVRDAVAADRAALLDTHRSHWHVYHKRSLVSVPDRTIQRFHVAQLYRAAAAGSTGARDGVAHPFLHVAGRADPPPAGAWTPPPGGFAVPGTGLRAAGGSLVDTWGLPALWVAYRHRLDADLLRDRLYPALVAALSRYEPYLMPGPTGALHLPTTHSPGYGDVADCTYDLSLLRWAAVRAARSAALLGRPAPEAARWQDLAVRLVPYHRDSTGVLVGDRAPLDRSHPEPAHLLWLHPLREAQADQLLMRRSLDHWAAMPEGWHGRSYAAAASMAAALGAAGEAYGYLSQLLHRSDGSHLGLDSDGAFAAAGALQDMLVGAATRPGGGTTLDVFPALWTGWRDVSIAGLRTAGAFTVDASRAGGRTAWIRVHSTTGAPVVVRHGIDGPVSVRVSDAGRSRPTGLGAVELRLRAGENAVLTAAGSPPPDLRARNVPAAGSATRWGLPTAHPVLV